MKKTVLLWLCVLRAAFCFGQLTIEACYDHARDNYPLIRQYGLILLAEQYDLQNASKSYLPQFALSGKATYQTDVTTIPIAVPGIDIPTLGKDQYQILAEVSQSIWDGGRTRAAKDAVRAEADVDIAQFEVDMYAIRERIDELFFGILLLDEQLRLNTLFLDDLQVNYDRVKSYLENGVANRADLDIVRVEQLGAHQNRMQLETNRAAYLAMLSALTGIPIGWDTELVRPEALPPLPEPIPIRRPEMDLFDAMARQLESRRESIRTSNLPQFGVFIQGGYGKPGLNMLEDKFKTFALGGVRLNWNFGNYYTRRNNLFKIESGIVQVDVQRETFLFNNNLQWTQLMGEYERYREVMRDDEEIILLRQNIFRASEAKYENGVISATDLVRDMISVQNARVNKVVHEIELLKTIYGLRNLTND